MPKKLLTTSLVITGILVAVALTSATASASNTVNYTDWGIGPATPEEETGCTSIPETWIDNSYMQIWHRHARCDEVRFHLDHGTSREKLEAWLQQVKVQKLGEAYGNNTFIAPSTGNLNNDATWWLDTSGVAHRVYDWPSMMSWGLLLEDTYSMPAEELGFWNRVVPKGSIMDYTTGPYYEQVQNYWDDSTYVPIVPQAIKDDLYANGHTHWGFLKYDLEGINKCNTWFPSRTIYKYLDWSYADALNTASRDNCNDW